MTQARLSPNAPQRASDPDQPIIAARLPNPHELVSGLYKLGFSLGGAAQIANGEPVSHQADRFRLATMLEELRRKPGRTTFANIVLERG